MSGLQILSVGNGAQVVAGASIPAGSQPDHAFRIQAFTAGHLRTLDGGI